MKLKFIPANIGKYVLKLVENLTLLRVQIDKLQYRLFYLCLMVDGN